MEISDLLDLSFAILQWVVDYIWILCGIIFMVIMIKTLFDVVAKNIEIAKPGVQKILGRRR